MGASESRLSCVVCCVNAPTPSRAKGSAASWDVGNFVSEALDALEPELDGVVTWLCVVMCFSVCTRNAPRSSARV